MPTHQQPQIAINVHRAFVYSACAPGVGDIYTGRRFKGYAILVLFIAFSSWMLFEFAQMISATITYIFGSLDSSSVPQMPELPVKSMSVAFIAILLIWYGGVISAVDGAVNQSEKRRLPLQPSVAWALGMSWLCPGAGQVYVGQRRLGWSILACFIIGVLLMIPAYKVFAEQLSGLLSGGFLDAGGIQETMRQVHNQIRMVDFSIGSMFKQCVKWFAIAAAMASLRQGPLRHDTGWLTRSPKYALALIGIGWLCPGAGQLLQGRRQMGWLFFCSYIILVLFIGLLAGANVITIEKAEDLEWLHIVVQWIAALEAPMAMRNRATTQE